MKKFTNLVLLVLCLGPSALAQGTPWQTGADPEWINNLPPGPNPVWPNPNAWWPAGPGEWLDYLGWVGVPAPAQAAIAKAKFTARTGGVPNVSPSYAYKTELIIHEWIEILPGNLIKQFLIKKADSPLILEPGDPPVTWDVIVGKTTTANSKTVQAEAWIGHSDVDLATATIVGNWVLNPSDRGEIHKNF